MKRAFLASGSSGSSSPDFFDEGVVELERQQVGVREIAIVVRLLLGAHRPGFALGGIEQAGLLLDPAARLDQLDLAPRLVVDRAADEAHRVQVLDLGAGAERRARPADRDVGIAAQRALLHVAIAGAEVAEDRAQLAHVEDRLLGRAQVGLGDDLHQRHARAVEVDQRRIRALIVQALAGVHLDVQARDADPDAAAVLEVDRERAAADQRPRVLRDLIAARQVGVEVVLALEHRVPVDLGREPEARAHRLLDAKAVERGQHARHAGIDRRDVMVGGAAELGRGAREQLGPGA